MKVLIDGIVYDVIIERKNNKNTYLRVKEDLNIYVTTSYLTPDFMIKKFVLNNKEFILKQMDKMEKRLDKKLEYYYLGNKIDVVIINTLKKTTFENNTLYVKNKSEIEKWYKKQMKMVFKEHLNYIYNKFTKDVPYPNLVIRKMKTRWGVCNKNLKKVTLNSELIYKDIKCLDYVIVHELSHFIHFNHSKEFWKLVEENYPNYKIVRKEMRE